MIVASVPRWVWPLTMIMIGAGRRSAMICFIAPRPSSSGISTSMVMMSGLRSRASSTASRPLRASPTTVMPSLSMMRRSAIRMKVELSTTRTRRRGGAGGKAPLMPRPAATSGPPVDRISTERPFAVPRAAMRGSWPAVGRMSSRAMVTMRCTPFTARTRCSPSCRSTMWAPVVPVSPSDSQRQPSVTGTIRPPYSIAPSTPAGAPAGRMTDWRGGRTRSTAASASA